MPNIGQKLYYDKTTGEVIQRTSQKEGEWARQSTLDEDIFGYLALSERNRDTFDVIELPFGAYAQDFAECNGYRVNPITKELEFDYSDKFTIDDYKQFKINEMFKYYKEDLLNGFISSLVDVNNTAYEIFYDEDSQMKINAQTNKVNLLLNRLSLNQITQLDFDNYFPIEWRTKNLGVVNLSYEDYLIFADEVEKHERVLLTKRLQKEGYINTLSTKEEIESVIW
jgi:hypothetical protein